MPFSIVHQGDIPYLLAPNLQGHKGMLHAFTTRIGGVSKRDYSSLNLAFHVEDDYASVIENRSRVAGLFSCNLSDSVAVRQVHGIEILKVTAQDKGQGALEFNENVPEADALVTNEPGILLWCFFADCVPVLLYDPVKKVIAAVHAGWRGTQRKIAAETVKFMKKQYGCDEQHILAAIGPSAGACCYEVKQDVADLFTAADLDAAMIPEKDGYRINLWNANQLALIKAGVPEKNISISELCTSCLSPLFFSYRAENGITGRFAAAIMLK